ncbi:TetR/AcrR family transcriptional regulator [Georgenia sp. Z1491]|uniref:TetR/AcrR family transcriptional regulator n=1 Tax=Georgenia sp. Z1491 TaxID=3416707 RepID=UPI003CF56E65
MSRPRPYDDDLRADLLRAAGRALAAGGENSVSIRAVAAEAGTTTAGVYALFGSRDRLVAEVTGRGLKDFRALIARRRVHEDPLEDFVSLCHAYRRAAREMPNVYRAFGVLAERHGQTRLTGEHGPHQIMLAVERLLSPDTSPEELHEHAATVLALVHGLVLLEIDHVLTGSEEDNEARFERALGRLALTSTHDREHT